MEGEETAIDGEKLTNQGSAVWFSFYGGRTFRDMSQTGTKAQPIDRRLRVLLADDHAAIRKRVRSILEQHPGFEVVAEVPDGAQAVEEAKKLEPDVVVLNVNMPILNGLEAAREIKTRFPQSAIVILSLNADKRLIEEAKKTGACAYVAKSKAAHELVKAIEAAIAGGEFVVVA
jgi:DNA-binding NarL/FixJ family response regulator